MNNKLKQCIISLIYCISVVGLCSTFNGIAYGTPQGDNATSSLSPHNLEAVESVKEHPSLDGTLTIQYLDVGQGDSAFIEFPDGKSLLIDAGEADYATKVLSVVRASGYESIDNVIATHPHADHIGGMAQVLSEMPVDTIWMPNRTTNTKTFENLLSVLEDSDCTLRTPSAGEIITSGENYKVVCYGPIQDYENMNNCSIVVKIEFGENTFLFTGDAEYQAEEDILASGRDLQSDVLKVGHHGSITSTSTPFLNAVAPRYAIISCGDNNAYGHPHDSTLANLTDSGCVVLRTDTQGTITINSNGTDVWASTEH